VNAAGNLHRFRRPATIEIDSGKVAGQGGRAQAELVRQVVSTAALER